MPADSAATFVQASAAIADTVHHARRLVESFGVGALRGAGSLEAWHEFYLLAGTAAVTLVGLLFVALSFNLDVLVHESKAHVLAHARSTLLNFTYVLILSLGFLIPNQGAGPLGVLMTVLSAVVLTIHFVTTRRRPAPDAPPFDRSMRRRGRLYTIGYGVGLVNGVAMVVSQAPQLAFNMIAVICMLLGNAMGMSWDLLVEVGKLKSEQAAGGAKAPTGGGEAKG